MGWLAGALTAPSLVLARVRPLRIGVIGSWSGPYAGGGRQFDAGMAVWLAAHNQHIAGRPVDWCGATCPAARPTWRGAMRKSWWKAKGSTCWAGSTSAPTPTPWAPSPRRRRFPWW
nr:hypothetical protein [Variovorax sp. E3]